MQLTLTGLEIRDLAEAVGLVVEDYGYSSEFTTEMTIADCPPRGIEDDDGKVTHYRYITYVSDHPEEGGIGLGEEVAAPGSQGKGGVASDTEARIACQFCGSEAVSHGFCRGYAAGWAAAAQWAKRDDLICDVDSPAYIQERGAVLNKLLEELAGLEK